MSGRLGEARCREILEVGPGAGPDEIHRAYQFLRHLYAEGGLAAPSMDEFSGEAMEQVRLEVEAAYRELCEALEPERPAPPAVRPALPDPSLVLDGAGLRRLREAQGFTLERLAAETSVRAAYLEALEDERFRDLPGAAVIVRGYLTAWFAALGMDGERSVADYVRRFQAWHGKS